MPGTSVIEPRLTTVTRDRTPLTVHRSASDPPTRIGALVKRIRATYLEMTGLGLTVDEARCLWQLDHTECEALLAAFVAAGFLRRSRNGVFTHARSATVTT